jgi:hypothetical protein
MDDYAYGAALLEILANPDPSGIDPADPNGRADDGIDRYNGFGRDEVVDSVELVEGEFGAELEVAFVLDLPDDLRAQGMARRGSVRVPVDREWRELSGYQEPSAYAPVVAVQVEMAARQLVEDHQSRRRGTRPIIPEAPGTHWEELLHAGHWTPVQVAPDRIELREPHGTVTMLVTPEEWEYVVATRAGRDIDIYLAEVLAPRQEDERFVVFYQGDLRRSIREKLPPVRGRAFAARMDALRAENPTAEFGWFAHTPSPPKQGQ